MNKKQDDVELENGLCKYNCWKREVKNFSEQY